MRVSVVMSVYKEPVEWIRQSIDSILNQTFVDFEFVIVNDNPTRKENQEVLEEYVANDSRVIVITNEENIGLTKSLNKGIAVAKGEYIARMDADDISMPERFEKQVYFLDFNVAVGVVGTAVDYFGKKKGVYSFPERHKDMYIFLNSCFAHPSIMGRSKIIKKFRYDESFPVAQDYDLWERMYEKNVVFANLAETLLKYRVSDVQITSSRFKQQLASAAAIRKRALLFYLKKEKINGVDLERLNFSDVKRINKCKSIPLNILKQLNYMLLLSMPNMSLFRLMSFLLRNQAPLSFSCKLKLIYHRINNHNLVVFA